jgi:hypothetical protein
MLAKLFTRAAQGATRRAVGLLRSARRVLVRHCPKADAFGLSEQKRSGAVSREHAVFQVGWPCEIYCADYATVTPGQQWERGGGWIPSPITRQRIYKVQKVSRPASTQTLKYLFCCMTYPCVSLKKNLLRTEINLSLLRYVLISSLVIGLKNNYLLTGRSSRTFGLFWKVRLG